jgi:hypothetical protein
MELQKDDMQKSYREKQKIENASFVAAIPSERTHPHKEHLMSPIPATDNIDPLSPSEVNEFGMM